MDAATAVAGCNNETTVLLVHQPNGVEIILDTLEQKVDLMLSGQQSKIDIERVSFCRPHTWRTAVHILADCLSSKRLFPRPLL